MNICVFCSSSDNLAASYKEAATDFGRWIGQKSHTLVYGGSEKGLMAACSHAAKESGAKIVSVAPPFVKNGGLLNPQTDETVVVRNLAERKNSMMELSDVFVALPGGIGTLDEVFSVLACNIVGECDKPVLLLNINGVYSYLQNLTVTLLQERLMRPDNLKNLHYMDTVEDCISLIENNL